MSKPTHEDFASRGLTVRHCTKCAVDHPIMNFSIIKSQDNEWKLNTQCRPCVRKRENEYVKGEVSKKCRVNAQKSYRERYPERVKESRRKSRAKRAEKIRQQRESPEGKAKQREYQRTYRERHKYDPNKPRTSTREYQNEYNKRNREKKRAQWRKSYYKNIDRAKERGRLQNINGDKRRYGKAYWARHKNNPNVKLRNRLRCRVRDALKAKDVKKTQATMDLIGCSIEVYRRHLESLFLPGMTWENHGAWEEGNPIKWHIDHIKPCASFDLTDPEQQKACFHYMNTQPMWVSDNLRKSDSLEWPPKSNPHHC